MPSVSEKKNFDEISSAEKNRLKEWAAAYLSLKDSISEDLKSPQELLTVFQHAGRNPSMQQIEKIWSKTGADGINFDDFCQILEQNPDNEEKSLLNAFRKLDANRDGFLSFRELKQILQKVRGFVIFSKFSYFFKGFLSFEELKLLKLLK